MDKHIDNTNHNYDEQTSRLKAMYHEWKESNDPEKKNDYILFLCNALQPVILSIGSIRIQGKYIEKDDLVQTMCEMVCRDIERFNPEECSMLTFFYGRLKKCLRITHENNVTADHYTYELATLLESMLRKRGMDTDITKYSAVKLAQMSGKNLRAVEAAIMYRNEQDISINADDSPVVNEVSSFKTPEEQMAEKETNEALYEAINGLSECAKACVQGLAENKTEQSIANMINGNPKKYNVHKVFTRDDVRREFNRFIEQKRRDKKTLKKLSGDFRVYSEYDTNLDSDDDEFVIDLNSLETE